MSIRDPTTRVTSTIPCFHRPHPLPSPPYAYSSPFIQPSCFHILNLQVRHSLASYTLPRPTTKKYTARRKNSLIPLLHKPSDPPLLDLKNRTRRPMCPLPRSLDPIMRLSTMTSCSTVSQQHMSALRKEDVYALDMQVFERSHDFGMGVGVVEGRFTAGESCWGDEFGVSVA